MLEYLMFAVRTERRNGRHVATYYITPDQYRYDFFKNLYYREVNGNRAHHRCEYANDMMRVDRYLKWETYGNGYKCEWELYELPRSAGDRELEIVSHMVDIEHYEVDGHELVTMYAVLGDADSGYERHSLTYDMTTGRLVP